MTVFLSSHEVLIAQRKMKMFSLGDYRKEKQAILSNDKLSKKGKNDALAKLEQSSKEDARKAVNDLRKSAVKSALALRDAQAQRLDRSNQAIKSLDYQRLNYELEVVRSKIKESESLSDVVEAFEVAKGSNDVYILKTWKDTSKGLISDKFGGSADFLGFKDKLFDDILSVKVEKVHKSDVEIEALNGLREIEGQAREINEAFGAGQAVVQRVLDGIAFDGEKVELGFEREVNVFDKLEKDYEVFNRLESEREKAIENHKEVTKGFGAGLDYDFDDLSGAL